jgi:hypothetical protein
MLRSPLSGMPLPAHAPSSQAAHRARSNPRASPLLTGITSSRAVASASTSLVEDVVAHLHDSDGISDLIYVGFFSGHASGSPSLLFTRQGILAGRACRPLPPPQVPGPIIPFRL